jgi:predicted  nucleic acid-binding Zn-ribbon protein
VFSTEQAVDPATISPEVLAEAVADPESETYQFVARALLHDGDAEIANLAERAVTQQLELDRGRARIEVLEAELAQAREEIASLRADLEEAVAHARGFEELAKEHEQHIEALRSTRSYRMLAPLRAVFGRRA